MKTTTYHLIGFVILFNLGTLILQGQNNYCGAQGNSISGEYIGNVTINSVDNNTINTTTSGYSDYKSEDIYDTLDANSTGNTISVRKHWPLIPFPEAVSVWIDFNNDGDFTSDEKIMEDASNEDLIVSTTFDVPANAVNGDVVMRVIMKYYGSFGTIQDDPCETYNNGETEDYMLRINNQLSVDESDLSNVNIYPNPFKDSLTINLPNNNSANQMSYTVYDIQGRLVLEDTISNFGNNSVTIDTMNALNPGTYLIKLENTQTQQFVTKRLIKQ